MVYYQTYCLITLAQDENGCSGRWGALTINSTVKKPYNSSNEVPIYPFINMSGSVNDSHRHIRRIDCLTAYTACLVCLISIVSGCSKKKEEKSQKCGASSGHITNHKQSIFSINIYDNKPAAILNNV
jgi:hypothetical protein